MDSIRFICSCLNLTITDYIAEHNLNSKIGFPFISEVIDTQKNPLVKKSQLNLCSSKLQFQKFDLKDHVFVEEGWMDLRLFHYEIRSRKRENTFDILALARYYGLKSPINTTFGPVKRMKGCRINLHWAYSLLFLFEVNKSLIEKSHKL